MSQNPGSGTGMEIALPHTGELISLEDARACAIALHEWREVKQRGRDFEQDAERVVMMDSERQGTKTLRYEGGIKAEVKTSTIVDWDFDKLEQLRDAGLPEDRYNELVVETVTQTVSARVADQLSRANPEYKRIIELAKHPREAKNRVYVVRS